MSEREPRCATRRTTLKALAGTVLPTRAIAQSQATNGSRTKTLRYPFEVAETGFDPAQLIDLYSRIVTAHIFENFYE